MSTNLVPYHNNNALIPEDSKVAALVVAFASTGNVNYSGPAVLAITALNTVALCGPDGILQEVHFEEIHDVTVVDFRGITIERPMSDGKTRRIQPTDAFGIEITYQPPGQMRRRLKAMTFFRDIAEAWAATIGNEVEAYNSNKYVVISPGTIRDAPIP
jgi:hypothetical protein